MREIIRALKAHLAQPDPADDPLPAGNYPPLDPVKPKAPEDLAPLQKDLGRLLKALHRRQIPVVIVFEGTDTAGKGGTIRRVTRQMDPRGFHVATVAAPSQADLDRHYLGRFYRDFPEKGHLTIFDRSYYGRVLVERVEGLTPTERISEAYDEIVAMEESLVRGQVLVLKFLLVIDKAVQNDRLIDRAKDPDKRYKLTDEDWRNYNKYEAYTEAMAEMVARTSKAVPWQVVDANSKPEARYHILKAVRDALEEALAESEDGCICD
ncbi:polyphosphate kinase 2 family protein [Peptococcus simiae]|uniref:Polyphosphate kinase 2 family protein n=1 Tax=Peptococcus simiae TaxID=1643805 RepID=A0ABW9H2N7_9FIRM